MTATQTMNQIKSARCSRLLSPSLPVPPKPLRLPSLLLAVALLGLVACERDGGAQGVIDAGVVLDQSAGNPSPSADKPTPPAGTEAADGDPGNLPFEKIVKTNEQWKKELTAQQYHITREHGTEQRFTSPLLNEKRKGTYYAVGGTVPLFSSETKYDSRSGWPSFYDVIDRKHIKLVEDHSLGVRRIEVLDAQTGHHLGHVFPDGPQPTGLRYCINGEALRFEPAEKPAPSKADE